jgi:hypothetical protein
LELLLKNQQFQIRNVANDTEHRKGLLNKDEILARQYFQAFYKRSDARLWHLEAQNPCTLLEKCEVKLETDL